MKKLLLVINKYLPHKKCDHVGTGTSCLVCGVSEGRVKILILFYYCSVSQWRVSFCPRVFIKFCCKNIEGGFNWRLLAVIA